jgi:hypothetical protein
MEKVLRISSVVERTVHTREVIGAIPVSATNSMIRLVAQ